MDALERAIKALEPMDATAARAVVEGLAQSYLSHAAQLQKWGNNTPPNTGPALRKLANATGKLRTALVELREGFPGLVPTASDPALAALLERLDREAETAPRFKPGPREDLSRRELLRLAFFTLGERASGQRVADLAMASFELATKKAPATPAAWLRMAEGFCADLRHTNRLEVFLRDLGRGATFADLAAFTESEELRRK
jgi:hypothetical protein